jgi:hypothetical protein
MLLSSLTPLVVINQEGTALRTYLYYTSKTGKLDWIRAGDSGSPIFLVHRGQLVLVGVLWSLSGQFQRVNFELVPLTRGFIDNREDAFKWERI